MYMDTYVYQDMGVALHRVRLKMPGLVCFTIFLIETWGAALFHNKYTCILNKEIFGFI